MLRSRKVAAPRRRVTGVAAPAALDPASLLPGEIDKVRRLITFFAERRALGAGWVSLDRESIIKSVATIRHELHQLARVLPPDCAAMLHISMMRATCRQFADRIEPPGSKSIVQHQEFYGAIGGLRALLGLQLLLLAERYGVAIDPRLESILPPVEE